MTGIVSPYDPSQPMPGTAQTGNQPTKPTVKENSSSTVGNIPIYVANKAATIKAGASAAASGMPQQSVAKIPTGSITPSDANDRQWASTYSPAASAVSAGPVVQGVAKEATVSGNMEGLLKYDSPYMKMAQDYALREMNARGLMSSSLAVGAAHEAAIKSALPMAQQDASTFLSQAQTNQNWQNKFIEDQNAYLRNLDTLGANTRAQSALSYQDLMQDISKIDAQSQAERDKISASLSADIRKLYLDNSARLYDSYMQQYAQIQQSDMAASQKQEAVATLEAQFRANRDWINAAYANMSSNSIDLAAFKSMGVPAENSVATAPADGTQQFPGVAPSSAPAAGTQSVVAMQAAKLINSFGYPREFVDSAIQKNIPLYNEQGQRLVSIDEVRDPRYGLSYKGVYSY